VQDALNNGTHKIYFFLSGKPTALRTSSIVCPQLNGLFWHPRRGYPRLLGILVDLSPFLAEKAQVSVDIFSQHFLAIYAADALYGIQCLSFGSLQGWRRICAWRKHYTHPGCPDRCGAGVPGR